MTYKGKPFRLQDTNTTPIDLGDVVGVTGDPDLMWAPDREEGWSLALKNRPAKPTLTLEFRSRGSQVLNYVDLAAMWEDFKKIEEFKRAGAKSE